jgi:2-oxoglutarate ferredoxin oxidoreductase subunit gamma
MNPGSRIEIRIGGTGGQGLILSGKMLADALASMGRRVAQSQTYEPTSRGGFCNSDLVVSEGEVDFPLATAVDYLGLTVMISLPGRSWSGCRRIRACVRNCPKEAIAFAIFRSSARPSIWAANG